MLINKDYILNIENLIPDGAREILLKLENRRFHAFLVGGCTRDSILGKTPSDWDICTSATPQEVLDVFKEYRTIPTGLKHGTITVMIDGEPYEVTTFRIEKGYSDNRRPDKVSFVKDIVQDLSRRDFTINAIAYNPSDGFVDPFNGISDINNGIIRCVGNPLERFNEDGLRILRALRFAARFGFEIEKETSEAIFEKQNLLANISKERINSELCKILMSERCGVEILRKYREVFGFILPALSPTFSFNQNNPHHCYDVWEHTLHSLFNIKLESDLVTRLAVLFHDIGKPHCYSEDENGVGHFHGHAKISGEMTDEIMRELRFSNKDRVRVVELVSYHDVILEERKTVIKRLLNKMGEEQLRRLFQVKIADIYGQNRENEEWKAKLKKVRIVEKMLEEVIEEENCFKLKDLKVNGNNLMEAGIPKGPEIGRILNILFEMVVNEEIKNEKEVLIEIAREIYGL